MSTESNRILLKHHLEKLRLPTVRREWESVAAACAGEGVTYGDFLLRLTERELIEREQRAAQRRVKSAKFPVLKTLESFDFGAQPSIKEALVRELSTGEYLEARENVLLIGNSGTGKTQCHRQVALAQVSMFIYTHQFDCAYRFSPDPFTVLVFRRRLQAGPRAVPT